MVTLINKTRKLKVFNLDHPFFRSKKWGAKRLNVVVIEEHKDGSRYPREVRRLAYPTRGRGARRSTPTDSSRAGNSQSHSQGFPRSEKAEVEGEKRRHEGNAYAEEN